MGEFLALMVHWQRERKQAGTDDGSGAMRWWDGQIWPDQVQPPMNAPADGLTGLVRRVETESVAGAQPRPAPAGVSYVALQVILKEKQSI